MLAPPITALLALVLVGTALSAMGSLPPAARPGVAEEAPFRCALELGPLGAGTSVLARVTAARAVSGTYRLTLRAGGNAVDQAGDFEAAPGQTVTLGEATLPGAPEALSGGLEVEAGGARVECPREQP